MNLTRVFPTLDVRTVRDSERRSGGWVEEGAPPGVHKRGPRAYDGEFEPLRPDQVTPSPNAARAVARHLSPVAIANIRRHHELAMPRPSSIAPPVGYLPTYLCCYAPSDGRFVGTLLDADVNANRHVLVQIASDHLPTTEDLARIIVAVDGVVSWPTEEEV